MAVVTLNFVFIGMGMAQLETLPVYAKNEAGVTEKGIGLLLPEHARDRPVAAADGAAPGGAPPCGRSRCSGGLGGRAVDRPDCGDRRKRLGRLGFPRADLRDHRLGECLHGTVQAPLVADLADHSLIGRYMVRRPSWGVGFAVGPAIGGSFWASRRTCRGGLRLPRSASPPALQPSHSSARSGRRPHDAEARSPRSPRPSGWRAKRR